MIIISNENKLKFCKDDNEGWIYQWYILKFTTYHTRSLKCVTLLVHWPLSSYIFLCIVSFLEIYNTAKCEIPSGVSSAKVKAWHKVLKSGNQQKEEEGWCYCFTYYYWNKKYFCAAAVSSEGVENDLISSVFVYRNEGGISLISYFSAIGGGKKSNLLCFLHEKSRS